jgi:pimeloyl-ACP methyl ester carboxylesterase
MTLSKSVSRTVILLHGLASSANSRKAQFLRARLSSIPSVVFHAIDFNPTPADFEHMTITGMIDRLRQLVLHERYSNLTILGSSMGALVALHYAHRFGDVRQMMLLAPALSYGGLVDEQDRRKWKLNGSLPVMHYAFEQECALGYAMQADGVRYASWVAPAAPTTIIHGSFDDVIPLEHSQDYADAYPSMVKLVEVDSDHRLSDQLEPIWEHLRIDLDR